MTANTNIMTNEPPQSQSLSNWTLEPIEQQQEYDKDYSATTTAGTAIRHKSNNPNRRYTYTFPSSLINGIPHPPFITQSNWDRQRQILQFRKSDLFICTFSKCGTTLAEQIVLLLLNGGRAERLNPLHKNTLDASSTIAAAESECSNVDEKKAKRNNNNEVIGKIWTEMAVIDNLHDTNHTTTTTTPTSKACMGEDKAHMTPTHFHSLPSPRILKTHAPPSLFLDTQRIARILYITRNPMDACVSCYYHPKVGVSPASCGMEFEAFVKLWLSTFVEFGGWIDHTRLWRKEYLEELKRRRRNDGGDGINSSSSRMLWMSYEELITQPVEAITQIANFIGVDITTDATLVQRVVEGSRFSNVKKAAERCLKSGGVEGNLDHLRKGMIGDWRNHFSEELFREFEEVIRQRMNVNDEGGVGLDLEYDIGEGMRWKADLKVKEQDSDEASKGEVEDVESGAIDAATCDAVFQENNGGSLQNDIEHEVRCNTPVTIDTKRLQDIHILGFTMVFYSLLQTTLQYVSEFYVDDLRDKNGLTQPSNFPAISTVMANIFNGVNGGLSLGTAIFAGSLIRHTYNKTNYRFAYYFFISTVIEAVVTSGVMHSVAHRLFGATLNGNAYVEFFSHIGYSLNVIVSAGLLIRWLAPTFLATSSPGWRPRPYEVVIAVSLSVLAILFTQVWVPYEPNPADFDYYEDHSYNEPRIILMQRNIQGVFEGLLLIPTVLFCFILGRLWKSIHLRDSGARTLSFTSFRICILSVMIPLCLNWVHFRCHDDLVNSIQSTFGWEHHQTIAAIRMVFHIPAWILAILRTHYFRVLTEEYSGWPKLDIIESICPGREVFPFAMVFLYRATEGMTIALLPQFFQGGTGEQYFYLDLVNNTWVAVTVLAMFTGNAFGAIGLGWLMQKKSYKFAYITMCCAFLVIFPLYMIPHSNTSFFVLRCVSSLLFPGPVVLSKITQNTRQTFKDTFKHIPMVVSLVWFNQGFWFGGVISNSSVWTPWNVFFTSAVVLFALFTVLFICFLISNKTSKQNGLDKTTHLAQDEDERIGESSNQRGLGSLHHYMQEGTNANDLEDANATCKSSVANDGSADIRRTELLRDNRRALLLASARRSSVRLSTFMLEVSEMSPDERRALARSSLRRASVRLSNLAVGTSIELTRDHKRTLLLARLASFANGASFACHISLLPIQVTSLVDLDVYEYTTIVSSLGSISTVLLLLSFRTMARKSISTSMTIAYVGHMVGTAVLCIPQLYTLPLGIAVASIVTSYGAVLLSFFVMNLSCEVSLGQLRKSVDKDAASGLQMGIIKSALSFGKVGGAAMVVFAFRVHPQLPLWILEGLLVVGASLTVGYYFIMKRKRDEESREIWGDGVRRRRFLSLP